ncbi:MAG: sigma-70 family RNA polymerase sigma factor [Nannocystaceae bacterium]
MTSRSSFERTALPLLDNLFGAAMRLTRNAAEAEDLVQDTMVRAYRFWDGFKPGTSIKAWLFTILRNTFINRYHRDVRARAGASDLSSQLDSIGPALAIASAGPGAPDPEQAADDRVTRAKIDDALCMVPEDYRLAVIMADLEGLSYKEIAEVMQCPIGTVMSRIHRGRKLLHKLLFDHAVETGRVQAEPEASSPAPVKLSAYREKREGRA